MTKKVAIESIRIDGGTQMRERINTDAVADYAEAYSNNAKMPPLDVFFDGKEYWLGNGFHRYHAVRKIGWKEVDCTIHKGTLREAILFAAGCNETNGLRRSNADKHAAVTALLNDPEWVQNSLEWIADAAKVSVTLVRDLKQKHVAQFATLTNKSSAKSPERLKGRDGKTRPAKYKTRKEKAAALHVPPIDADEPPKKFQVAAQDVGVTIGHNRAHAMVSGGEAEYVDKYAGDRQFARMVAELAEAGRKITMNAIDKANAIYVLNKLANEVAEAIEEAEAA